MVQTGQQLQRALDFVPWLCNCFFSFKAPTTFPLSLISYPRRYLALFSGRIFSRFLAKLKGIHMPSKTSLHAPSRAHLSLTNVGITLGSKQVLNDVNLSVTSTSRLGIIGENGRGKTTLLKILSGHLTPDTGTVALHGTLAVAEQEMSASGGRSVGDAVAEAIAPSLEALAELDNASQALAEGDPGADQWFAVALEQAEVLEAWDAERRIQLALEALEAETNHAVLLSTLSVGQRYRIRLACLLAGVHDFLLLDEPTNHLDRGGLEFLTARLRERSGGVVIVSHDRALLADVAESVLSLDPTPDGRPRLYGDGYAGYLNRWSAERVQWEQDYAQQQAEHARLQQDLQSAQDRLISGWRPAKGSGKHRRATRAASSVHSVQRRQAALDAHALSIPEPPLVLSFPSLASSNTILLSADAVSVAERLPHPISLDVCGGDRLVVTGPNGSGKSSLLNVLAGQLSPTAGKIHHRHGARIGLLQQESELPGNIQVNQLFASHIQRLLSRELIRADEVLDLEVFGLLNSDELATPVRELSMGQHRRLELALLLASRPQVLLLDEPTNHLSIRLVDELTEALEITGAAVVIATHDRQLLRDTAHWPRLQLQ